MSDPEGEAGPPAFDDPFGETDVEQRIYARVLQTREPATANAIAERVGCDPKTARKYLRWFAQLGIVSEHEGRPTTYERNDAYFEWQRVNDLASAHTREELQSKVREYTERIRAYEAQYDADRPSDVDAVAIAEAGDHGTIDDVYADLGDWATARQERELHERARQQRSETSDHEPVSS